MEPDDKRVYVYLTDDKDPVIINAMGYYIHEDFYCIIVDDDNQEIARFNMAYVKGIVRQ